MGVGAWHGRCSETHQAAALGAGRAGQGWCQDWAASLRGLGVRLSPKPRWVGMSHYQESILRKTLWAFVGQSSGVSD